MVTCEYICTGSIYVEHFLLCYKRLSVLVYVYYIYSLVVLIEYRSVFCKILPFPRIVRLSNFLFDVTVIFSSFTSITRIVQTLY